MDEIDYRRQILADLTSLERQLAAAQRAVRDLRAAVDLRPMLLRPRQPLLTIREREILQLLIGGYSSKEIAAVLGISNRTVDAHRGRILEKMGARSLVDVMRHLRQEEDSAGN